MAMVALSGDLDIYTIVDVANAFAAIRSEYVVIDVRHVRLVSAAFFGELARLRRRLPGSHIEVVGASAEVRKVFRLVRADQLVQLI
jgi:anti-anti-sigma regulatory factor